MDKQQVEAEVKAMGLMTNSRCEAHEVSVIIDHTQIATLQPKLEQIGFEVERALPMSTKLIWSPK